MRPLFLLGLFATACLAAETPAATDGKSSEKEEAIEHLISERESVAAFEKAVATAKKQGVSEQAVLEARFLFHVDRREDAAIAALLPEFLKRKDTFKIGDSEIFAVKEDWLAVIEYVEAIVAIQKDDREGFKKHILEAFWLSPRQGAAFAPHIERLRMADAMRDLRFTYEQQLAPLTGKDPVKLRSLIDGKKAMLLQFWSPSSRECETTLPDFTATAKELQAKNVAVVSILAENSPAVLEEGRTMIAKLKNKPSATWLVDDEKDPLNRLFRVQGIPVMVLLTPEGRVLFNGDPAEDDLWTELAKLSPGIKRPAVVEDAEHSHDDPADPKER